MSRAFDATVPCEDTTEWRTDPVCSTSRLPGQPRMTVRASAGLDATFHRVATGINDVRQPVRANACADVTSAVRCRAGEPHLSPYAHTA